MIHLDHLGYVGSPSNKSSTSSRAVSTGLSVAKLSEKYGISKARVEAVLRLKADEKQWEKSGKVGFPRLNYFFHSFCFFPSDRSSVRSNTMPVQ
jgi:hypothetical protein